MDSYRDSDQAFFDPKQAKVLPENCMCEIEKATTSEDFFKAGKELEYDPFKSELVQQTPRYNSGTTSKTEEAVKKGQEFYFDPASGRFIPIKKEPVDQVEQQLRDPSSDKHFGFDKKKKCLKVEEKSHQPQRDKQVKVDMNKRGTGGFF